MQALFERYRPRSWDDLIGHRKVRLAIEKMRSGGSLGGRAFLITGPSGVGKTTIAYLIAADVCDPENFVEIDAGDLTPAALDDLEKSLRYKCIGTKSGRAILINECHSLRKDTIRKLLVVLERIPNHVTWVLTTTNQGQQLMLDGIDSDPLFSRCVPFRLEVKPYLDDFAKRVQEIAVAEGLAKEGGNFRLWQSLAANCSGNFRRMLSVVESGEFLPEVVCGAVC